MRALAMVLGMAAVVSAGCATTSRRVVARRELGRTEQRSGNCVSRDRARTSVEVLGGGTVQVDAQILCSQQYVSRTRTEIDIATPASEQHVGSTLQVGGSMAILAGAAIGLSSIGEGFGRGIGGGCDDGCPDDSADDSNAAGITALVGAGMVVTGLVVNLAAGEDHRTETRDRVVDRRSALEMRPATQPFLVRAPIGGAMRVSPDEYGRAIVHLPADLLASTDRDVLAALLAQPWTLVIEGRVGSWTPTAIEVQRMMAAQPFAPTEAAGAAATSVATAAAQD